MPSRPTAFHLAMGFATAPTITQLKRYTLDSSKPIWLRKWAMMEVAARTGKRVTWLREVADSTSSPSELRQAANEWITLIKTARTGRALLRKLGFW